MIELFVDGICNALCHFGMLLGGVEPCDVMMFGDYCFVYGWCGGWWEIVVVIGVCVREGELFGVIKDLFGDVIEIIVLL